MSGVALAAVTIVGGVLGSPALASDLTPKAQQALQDAGLGDVQVTFTGREAHLSGGTPAEIMQAQQVVDAVDGVRWATIDAALPVPCAASAIHPGCTPPTVLPAPVPTQTPTTLPAPVPTATASDALSTDDAALIEKQAILFRPDSAALTSAARRQLDAVAAILAQHPGVTVQLVGHVAVAPHGSAQGREFSKRRAQAAAAYLEKHGVAAAQLLVSGAGTKDQVASSSTAAGAAKNRSVTITVLDGSN